MKLTKATLTRLTLPEGKTDHVVWDDELPGFGLRLRAGGSRTWIARYRLGTQQRVAKLGRVETLDPDKARLEARRVLARKELGEDPQAEKVAARARAAITLGSVVQSYLARHVEPRLKARSAEEVQRHLTKHAAPLHRHPIDSVTRSMIAARLSELATASGPIAANRVRASLGAMFAWAMRQGIVETNPVIATGRPGQEKSRTRVLQIPELAEVWLATDGPGDFQAIVRLLILTGARREEVAGLRWPELDFARGVWELPAERSKNRLPHVVPLSDAARAILEARPRRANRHLVFGDGEGPYSAWGQARKALARRILANREAELAGLDPAEVKPIEHFTLHDIRRSVVTGMNELGVAPHVVEAVVNHVSGVARAGVAGIYNKAQYLPEKGAALSRWAEQVISEAERRRKLPAWQSLA
jgi:integrase